MISREVLKSVLSEAEYDIPRYAIVERAIDFGDFPLHILVGIRRAGKSFLLFQQIQRLLKQGIGWDELLYLNFEDERIQGMGLQDLNLILELHYERYGKRPRLFLDEIQIVDGWQHFARRLADQKFEAFITGSNAKMLSSEINSTLGGRYLSHIIYPYSFSEFLNASPAWSSRGKLSQTREHALVNQLYDAYISYGGFPEIASLSVKRPYLESLYRKIFLGDINERYRLDNVNALRILFRKLAESVMHPISYNRLREIIASAGSRITTQTAINYVQYASEAWLIFSLENYASKLVEKETNKKYYFMDTGLLNLFLIDPASRLLENLVALELVRRFGSDSQVFFYSNGTDVDFVVPEKGLAVQACCSLDDGIDTRRREIDALVKLNRRLPLKKAIIITNSQEETIDEKGLSITVLPAWKWLIR